LLNAAGVLAVLEALRERLPVTAQAVRQGLASVELAGRFQIVPGQPALVLDVAHNPQAVAVLAANLDQMGFFPRTHAVFGAMHDKDLAGLIARISPLIDAWYCSDLPLPRAASARHLAEQLAILAPKARVSEHADPASALAAAIEQADPADRILVFAIPHGGGVLRWACRAWVPTRGPGCRWQPLQRPPPFDISSPHARMGLSSLQSPTAAVVGGGRAGHIGGQRAHRGA
jgi:dihydrofolate synthase/folylpolyglutamate synthase